MAFGFDIAITRNGELYLFEANRAPAVKTVLARTSRLRIQYYEYILNNIADNNGIKAVEKAHAETLEKYLGYEPEKVKRLENRIAVLEKEREYYKKEYNKMKNSSSWKLTVPVRKIGSLKKKLGKDK